MSFKSDKDIEGLLASCRLKGAPPGLRERVLLAARLADGANLRWGRRLKLCLVFCPALLALIFVADAARARSECNQIQALLNGGDSTPAQPVDDGIGWQDLTGDEIDAKLVVGLRMESGPGENLVRLRGDLEKTIREEVIGHEHQKNNN